MVNSGSGIHGELMENRLLSFWSDGLSRMFSEVQVGLDLSGGRDDVVIRPSGEDHAIA